MSKICDWLLNSFRYHFGLHREGKKERRMSKICDWLLNSFRYHFGLHRERKKDVRAMIREVFGHDRLRSWCLQVQPVTCWHPPVLPF